MAKTISCVLPPAVVSHIQRTHALPVYTILTLAVKDYLQERTTSGASAKAGAMAMAEGATKTDIYRRALIAFDNHIAEFWPAAPAPSSAALQRAHRRIQDSAPEPDPSQRKLSTVVRLLHKLKADAPDLTTRQIVSRLDTIINRAQP